MCIIEDDLAERRTRQTSSKALRTNHSANSMCTERNLMRGSMRPTLCKSFDTQRAGVASNLYFHLSLLTFHKNNSLFRWS